VPRCGSLSEERNGSQREAQQSNQSEANQPIRDAVQELQRTYAAA
jgi:hypothetical protein